MEAVLLIGLPATGKSSFCHERFRDTHVRLSLDVLQTRRREALLLDACLRAGQRFVLDNTNLARAERARVLDAARAAHFRTVGYVFRSVLAEAMPRNAARIGRARVPDAGMFAAGARFERPSPAEGFDALFYVTLGETGFTVSPWNDDL